MKKIILLPALFVITFGFGQNSKVFDFKDLKNIGSAKLFKKFCFDKEFVKVKNIPNFELIYAQGYDSDTEQANVWAKYSPKKRGFWIQLFRSYDGSANKSFENVLNQVKKVCKFYDFKDSGNDEYICYSCPNSSYKGKIGFLRSEESDIIAIFDF